MQKQINFLIYFALIAVIIYGYFQLQKYESLLKVLPKENLKLENKENYKNLQKKIDVLEAENKLLKDQVFQLENQQFLFNTNKIDDGKYKLEENLKFEDKTKELKNELEDSQKLKEQEESYNLKPSIEFNQDKKTIDGIKLEVETKF